MPTVNLTIPPNVWINISAGAASGSLIHRAGVGGLLLTQATTIPLLTPATANPIVATLHTKDVAPFSGLNLEKIWGYSPDAATLITLITPEA